MTDIIKGDKKMANPIVAAFTRATEGVQNFFETIGSTLSSGFGSAWNGIKSLFAGKEKNAIPTKELSIADFTMLGEKNATSTKELSITDFTMLGKTDFYARHRQLMAKSADTAEARQALREAQIETLREWGGQIGMPAETVETSIVKPEVKPSQSEVAYLLSSKVDNPPEVKQHTAGFVEPKVAQVKQGFATLITPTEVPKERVTKQAAFAQAYRYEFGEAFGKGKWKEPAQAIRVEISEALGKLFNLYNPAKLTSDQQIEIKQRLADQLDHVFLARDYKINEQVKALNDVKAEIEALVERMAG